MIINLIRPSLVLALISALYACASKERFNTANAINEECRLELEAARTAVRLRDQGKTQASLAEKLPAIQANSSRLLLTLHEIVTETYQYSALNEVIYPTYRFELCLRQLLHKPYPKSLASAEPGLLVCQRRYGTQSSQQSTECVQHAMDQAITPSIISTRQTTQIPESPHEARP